MQNHMLAKQYTKVIVKCLTSIKMQQYWGTCQNELGDMIQEQ